MGKAVIDATVADATLQPRRRCLAQTRNPEQAELPELLPPVAFCEFWITNAIPSAVAKLFAFGVILKAKYEVKPSETFCGTENHMLAD